MTRIPIRVASIALLLAGLAGGVYLGQLRPAPSTELDAAQVEIADMQLLKDRQNEHAAARARQTVAENAAQQKAAAVARAAAADAKDLEQSVKKAKAAAAAGPAAFTGEIPKSCNEFSGSRAIGCALTLQAGFGLDQFACLNKLWAKESGWNYRAENRSSGAYGIPQSLPGSKMAAFGADWKTNPATQIKWGLDYIKKRYDTPCGAWAHSEKYNNY
ncbi:hypothetical protein GCM10010168_36570 [Actinoplanes ianthinogenes]|uniref:Transglycosylase SLT domain-containing protein n=1 Tax=Actinoplanes ianthinogenes TaxID=122358 RepID=A0ABM7M5A2_9ACTN|nr:lytic transglycosylase domain-containing protein [Actinoplanes ianthinogenes]BCJ46821.1 hypothetical protein Aiant_74780 [Actinoplanes ianthinogenes]GGR15294.1 hypothetical protein GCM10010168_36570 [Actinoplanes ianthinogenes]